MVVMRSDCEWTDDSLDTNELEENLGDHELERYCWCVVERSVEIHLRQIDVEPRIDDSDESSIVSKKSALG